MRFQVGWDECAALMRRAGRGAALPTGGRRAGRPRTAAAVLMVVAATAGTMSCTSATRHDQHVQAPVPLAASTRLPAATTSVLTGAADVVAAGTAQALFASAPVVVLASPGPPAELAAGVRSALRAHAPLLLTSAAAGGTGPDAMVQAQIQALNPRSVLAVGVPRKTLTAQLPHIHVVTTAAMLPATTAPAALRHLALLVHPGASDPASLAAMTTARVAGAQVIDVRDGDPRADPAAIAALSAARPRQVLAVGAGFGPARQLASRIVVAQTGTQLPGGGQILFPGRLLVALYGQPGAPALGALGQQDLPASIARARRVAAQYRPLSHVPVVPAFEIIATVAGARPGPDRDYSYASSAASLRPWVREATAHGIYVILDLQPGRASLLAQAVRYQSLLELPDVGLALDPEWKLQPGQLPLHQIGGVSSSEANSVIRWLARLTARHRLPQKLLVLHQFRLSMIRDERELDTRYQDLAILIHMDGQGSPGAKEATWSSVIGAAPAGVFFGWKNFYVKDHPMFSPRATMTRTPHLRMVSYQ